MFQCSKAAAMLLCIALAPSSSLAQQTLTTRQMEALSARAANRTAQRDLLSILMPTGKIDSGMMRRLRGVGMQTRPFGTEYRGLCRQDMVSVLYAPTRSGADFEDVPVQPYGVETQVWFHFTPAFSAAHPQIDPSDQYIWRSECDKIGNDEFKRGWFAAQSAFEAVYALAALNMAVDELKAQRIRPESCGNIPTGESCDQAILKTFNLNELDQVKACPSPATSVCYQIEFAGHMRLTIKATRGSDQNQPRPTSIESIAVEEYIIVT